MTSVPALALVCAVAVSLAAAITDGRFGQIPNIVTLPAILLAPAVYGVFGGPPALLSSSLAAVLCATVPYALFRVGAMGGGDVKLFAALGALTGCDPLAGVRIQLVAFVAALLGVLCVHALQRRLPATLRAAFRHATGVVRHRRAPPRLSDHDATPVRLGSFVLVATVVHAAERLFPEWPS